MTNLAHDMFRDRWQGEADDLCAAWCDAARSYYLDFVAAGKTHERAVELAVSEADADLVEGVLRTPCPCCGNLYDHRYPCVG